MEKLLLYLWIAVAFLLIATLGLGVPGLAWRKISPGCSNQPTTDGIEDPTTTCWIGVTLLSVAAFCFLTAMALLVVIYVEARRRDKEEELMMAQQLKQQEQLTAASKGQEEGGGMINPFFYPHQMPKTWDAAAPYAKVSPGPAAAQRV